MHRFFLKQELPESGNLILNEKSVVRQMHAVLKLKAGESVLLFNGSGRNFEFRIAKISSHAAFGHIVAVTKNKRDPERLVYLYQALVKKGNFEWILQKCAELGVKKFIPMISERSVKKNINKERAEKIIQEAIEQSGQDKIPEITEPITFSEAVNGIGKSSDAGEIKASETIILCDPSGIALPDKTILQETPIHIFVGPEGGFAEQEVMAVRERGGTILSLGQRILRAETAAVAAASLILTPLEIR
jgi:16S rRNA (uracil1498-N3)-methyltransferase